MWKTGTKIRERRRLSEEWPPWRRRKDGLVVDVMREEAFLHTCDLLLLLAGLEVEKKAGKARTNEFQPVAAYDLSGIGTIPHPGQGFAAQAAIEESQKILSVLRKLRKQQNRISEIVARLGIHVHRVLRSVVDNCAGKMDGTVAQRQKLYERVMLFHSVERRAPSKSLIEEIRSAAR